MSIGKRRGWDLSGQWHLDSQSSWAGKASVSALLEIPGLSNPGGSPWQGCPPWLVTLPVLEVTLLPNLWNRGMLGVGRDLRAQADPPRAVGWDGRAAVAVLLAALRCPLSPVLQVQQ